MKNSEALLKFNVGYDAIASLQAPPLEIPEINTLFNDAMMNLIMVLNNAKQYDKLTEITIVEKLDLSSCIVESFGDHTYQATKLFSSFLYYVNAHALINRVEVVAVTNEWVKCTEVKRPEVDFYVQSPMNRQIIIYPKVFMHYGPIQTSPSGPTYILNIPVLLVDSYTTITASQGFEIVYIEIPDAIDLTDSTLELCQLNSELQELIVNEAIVRAMRATDEDRLKLAMQEQKQAK